MGAEAISGSIERIRPRLSEEVKLRELVERTADARKPCRPAPPDGHQAAEDRNAFNRRDEHGRG